MDLGNIDTSRTYVLPVSWVAFLSSGSSFYFGPYIFSISCWISSKYGLFSKSIKLWMSLDKVSLPPAEKIQMNIMAEESPAKVCMGGSWFLATFSFTHSIKSLVNFSVFSSVLITIFYPFVSFEYNLARQDLNLRHRGYESHALTSELLAIKRIRLDSNQQPPALEADALPIDLLIQWKPPDSNRERLGLHPNALPRRHKTSLKNRTPGGVYFSTLKVFKIVGHDLDSKHFSVSYNFCPFHGELALD